MLAELGVLAIDCIAGFALYSFIKPVTRSRYEEITSTPIDAAETLQQGEKPQ